VALRYTAAKARTEQEAGYVALLDPAGRCAGVFAAGSRRDVSSDKVKLVRRALQSDGHMRKRTSRPSRKRTSRG
jgi:hypothetical protein